MEQQGWKWEIYPSLVLTKLDDFLLTEERKGPFGGISSNLLGWYKSADDAIPTIVEYLKDHPNYNFVYLS